MNLFGRFKGILRIVKRGKLSHFPRPDTWPPPGQGAKQRCLNHHSATLSTVLSSTLALLHTAPCPPPLLFIPTRFHGSTNLRARSCGYCECLCRCTGADFGGHIQQNVFTAFCDVFAVFVQFRRIDAGKSCHHNVDFAGYWNLWPAPYPRAGASPTPHERVRSALWPLLGLHWPADYSPLGREDIPSSSGSPEVSLLPNAVVLYIKSVEGHRRMNGLSGTYAVLLYSSFTSLKIILGAKLACM